MLFKSDLENILNLHPTSQQLAAFDVYYQYLIASNQTTNLTRITDEAGVFYKHFFDSLCLVKAIDPKDIQTVCDMGSGAGFPSIPLKIMFPHLSITIVDSLNKRIAFLRQLTEKLGLDQVTLVHERAEVFAQTHKKRFDLVTARAFGHLSMIAEMGLPMIVNKGHLIAYKGINIEEELNQSKKAISILGGSTHHIHTFELPYGLGQRTLIHVMKEKHIEGYPRSFAQMTKRPL